jgi:diguanylate cyclase (GGDEF)-like protein
VAVVAVGAGALLSHCLMLARDPSNSMAVFGAVMASIEVVGLAASLRTARQLRDLPRQSRPWQGLAVAFLLLILAGVGFGLAQAQGGDQRGWLALGVAARILVLPALLTTLLLLPSPGLTGGQRLRFSLDLVTIIGGGVTVSWYLIVGWVLEAEGAGAVTAVASAGDLVVALTVCALLLRGIDAGGGRAVACLLGGIVLYLVGDVWVSHLVLFQQRVLSDQPVSSQAVMVVAGLLLAAAPQLRSAERQAGPSRAEQRPAGPSADWAIRPVTLLPYGALVAGYGTLAVALRGQVYPWAGLVAGVCVMTAAVSARQVLAVQEAHRLNTVDSLTSLANRRSMTDSLQRVLDRSAPDVAAAVLLVDLDRFKQVNDEYGHAIGDELLVAFAARLRGCLRETDVAARLGGDEFVIVLPGIRLPEQAVLVADRILRALGEPLRIAGRELRIRASIGISLACPEARTPLELLRRADSAMYEAKRSGGGRWSLNGLSEKDSTQRTTLEEDLWEALNSGQLYLNYQPIIDLMTGRVVAAEALMRWRHPRLGVVPPLEFIPLAESTGFIHELGTWLLMESIAQARRWNEALPDDSQISLSVNLSPIQLSRGGLAEEVGGILERLGLPPEFLVLELTESSVVDNDAAIPQLAALRGLGVRIALDDFGTGYSSLNYLTQLSVDILKLDRCFVATLNGETKGSAVAEAVIRLAKILCLDTIAEGVEDLSQARELVHLGCRTAQGYYFAKPLSEEDFMDLVRSGTSWTPASDLPAGAGEPAPAKAPASSHPSRQGL